jgi:hypothetical protein
MSASALDDVPVNDVACLNEPVYLSCPVTIVVDHVGHLENFEGIWIIAMQVSDCDDATREVSRRRWLV